MKKLELENAFASHSCCIRCFGCAVPTLRFTMLSGGYDEE